MFCNFCKNITERCWQEVGLRGPGSWGVEESSIFHRCWLGPGVSAEIPSTTDTTARGSERCGRFWYWILWWGRHQRFEADWGWPRTVQKLSSCHIRTLAKWGRKCSEKRFLRFRIHTPFCRFLRLCLIPLIMSMIKQNKNELSRRKPNLEQMKKIQTVFFMVTLKNW